VVALFFGNDSDRIGKGNRFEKVLELIVPTEPRHAFHRFVSPFGDLGKKGGKLSAFHRRRVLMARLARGFG